MDFIRLFLLKIGYMSFVSTSKPGETISLSKVSMHTILEGNV